MSVIAKLTNKDKTHEVSNEELISETHKEFRIIANGGNWFRGNYPEGTRPGGYLSHDQLVDILEYEEQVFKLYRKAWLAIWTKDSWVRRYPRGLVIRFYNK